MAGEAVSEWLYALAVVPQFYLALQGYDCRREDWEVIESLIADEMTYLTPNFTDRTPVARAVFLDRFREIHEVHAAAGRGSTYSVGQVVLTAVSPAECSVSAPIALSHWADTATPGSTWFYGRVNAVLVGGGDSWRMRELELAIDRREGHDPPIDHLYEAEAGSASSIS